MLDLFSIKNSIDGWPIAISFTTQTPSSEKDGAGQVSMSLHAWHKGMVTQKAQMWSDSFSKGACRQGRRQHMLGALLITCQRRTNHGDSKSHAVVTSLIAAVRQQHTVHPWRQSSASLTMLCCHLEQSVPLQTCPTCVWNQPCQNPNLFSSEWS